jgi:hypothetical protein
MKLGCELFMATELANSVAKVNGQWGNLDSYCGDTFQESGEREISEMWF